jgi:hypothetical protein
MLPFSRSGGVPAAVQGMEKKLNPVPIFARFGEPQNQNLAASLQTDWVYFRALRVAWWRPTKLQREASSLLAQSSRLAPVRQCTQHPLLSGCIRQLRQLYLQAPLQLPQNQRGLGMPRRSQNRITSQ